MKQLLRVAGLDRYFQIARCFRDEAQRTDRQPEFTQLDIELTFVEEPDVMGLIEELYVRLTERFSAKRILVTPFPRFTYRGAINRFGGNRPDLHFGLEMCDVSDALRETGFRAFAQTLAMGGQVRVTTFPGCADYTRREIDELAEFATRAGANGLATFTVEADGIRAPVAEFLSEQELAAMTADVGAQSGDLAVADMPPVVAKALSAVRDELGQRLSLADPNVLAYCWIYESPLLEWNAEEGRWEATHNPFSGLLQEGGSLLETHPADVRAKQ
jgi:aspartyl-tRNA synthetase